MMLPDTTMSPVLTSTLVVYGLYGIVGFSFDLNKVVMCPKMERSGTEYGVSTNDAEI
jgi:hypothetical protein